ncbi:MAG: penicillin acylase family protein, partial [Deltaproteobacteria bacterium]
MELPDVSRPFRFLIPLILVVSFAFQGCSTVFRNSVPERDGEVKGEVSSPVHVYRDRWGVPHIVAETLDDLLYAQGFVHAQERLFQMETERRLASGRLSEVYGKDALPLDRFFRSLSLKEKAGEMYRNLSEEDRRLIDRYVAGVNRAIETMKKPPPEMRLLSVEPEPFKGSDVALTALLKGFGLAQWLEELAYRVVLERAGEEKLKDILPFREDLYGISVIRHGNRESLNLEEADRLLTALLSFPLFPRTGGSNSWVVSGRKTADGLPRLFNDPHLPLTAPSVWFENHLIAKGFEVYGFSFPGAPFVVIGFNRHVAWGFTNVMMDDADLFVEEEGEKGGYLYRGRERKWEERRETISIRGENPEEIVVRKSVHGPLIPSLFPGLRESFAFRWTGYDAPPGHLTALMWLNKARSAEDVISALSRFSFPAQNVVFATSSGDIGYVLAGRIPKRKKVHPPLPVPGSSGEFDWEGYVDFRKNPKKLNPPEGFIATANFPPLPPGESPYISSVYEPPARGRRILKVLKGKDVFSLDELLALQTDVKLEPAEREKSLFVKILGKTSGLSEKERKALDLLASWDGSLNRNSAGGALFEVLYEEVLKNTFADELGNEGYRIFSRT